MSESTVNRLACSLSTLSILSLSPYSLDLSLGVSLTPLRKHRRVLVAVDSASASVAAKVQCCCGCVRVVCNSVLVFLIKNKNK